MDRLLLIIYYFLYMYYFVMIAYIILSWTPLVNSRFYQILRSIVNPYLGVFRGWFVFSGMDFTPMVGLLIYWFILRLVGSAVAASATAFILIFN
ncbi:MAG: YggT family protein [Candidatus Izimaplasma sp.]|nr:YggT family protein [Candidatus Izimaplasma bacterium]